MTATPRPEQALLIKGRRPRQRGDSLTFDGSRGGDDDGHFGIIVSAGDDTVTGGAQGDHFHPGEVAASIAPAHGGGGNDVFFMGDSLWSDASDRRRRRNHDTVHVTGFAGRRYAQSLTGDHRHAEHRGLRPRRRQLSWTVTTDDATVAAGQGDVLTDRRPSPDNQLRLRRLGRDRWAGSSSSAAVAMTTLTGGAGADTFHAWNLAVPTPCRWRRRRRSLLHGCVAAPPPTRSRWRRGLRHGLCRWRRGRDLHGHEP